MAMAMAKASEGSLAKRRTRRRSKRRKHEANNNEVCEGSAVHKNEGMFGLKCRVRLLHWAVVPPHGLAGSCAHQGLGIAAVPTRGLPCCDLACSLMALSRVSARGNGCAGVSADVIDAEA